MWDRWVKQWVDMVFWWMPRGDRTPVRREAPERKASPQAMSQAEQRTASPPKPAPVRTPDDLTAIKGIGPAVQKKLNALDIISFGDLAAADVDALTEKLKGSQPISAAQVRAWTEAARARSTT